jgi:periplasmic protein TonB
MLRRISLTALLITIAMPGYTQTDTGEEWRKQIVIRLSATKRFPLEARGHTGTAKVGFVLDRRGRLVSHWLEESTGNHTLDVESLAIVERAQPFPIPPSELDETHLRMSAPFVFAARPAHQLRDGPDIGKIKEIFQGEAQVDTKMRSICRGC